jgi:cation-transporting P-type ATPase D
MPQQKVSNKERQNPHGKLVVEKVMAEGAARIGEFIKLWRTNFMNSMQPKFLPLGWSIDHTIERSFGLHSKFKKKEGEENASSTASPGVHPGSEDGAG